MGYRRSSPFHQGIHEAYPSAGTDGHRHACTRRGRRGSRAEDVQLIDELRRGEAASARAHRRERRGVLALPQVGQCGRARLGPFGLGVGLAQVDVDAHAATPGLVRQIEQQLGGEGVGGVREDAHGRRGRHRVQRHGDLAFA